VLAMLLGESNAPIKGKIEAFKIRKIAPPPLLFAWQTLFFRKGALKTGTTCVTQAFIKIKTK